MLKTPFLFVTGSLLGLLLLAWRTGCCTAAAFVLALFFAGLAWGLASSPTTPTFSLSSSTVRALGPMTPSLSRLRFLLLNPCGTGGRVGNGIEAPPIGGARTDGVDDSPRAEGMFFSGVLGVLWGAKLMAVAERKVKSPGMTPVARRGLLRLGDGDVLEGSTPKELGRIG